jgi:hypothetical protein
MKTTIAALVLIGAMLAGCSPNSPPAAKACPDNSTKDASGTCVPDTATPTPPPKPADPATSQ